MTGLKYYYKIQTNLNKKNYFFFLQINNDGLERT